MNISRRLTLLHLTDTRAQLETHSEYLPGESPELQMMGGFARLMSAMEPAYGPAKFRAQMSTLKPKVTDSAGKGQGRRPMEFVAA